MIDTNSSITVETHGSTTTVRSSIGGFSVEVQIRELKDGTAWVFGGHNKLYPSLEVAIEEAKRTILAATSKEAKEGYLYDTFGTYLQTIGFRLKNRPLRFQRDGVRLRLEVDTSRVVEGLYVAHLDFHHCWSLSGLFLCLFMWALRFPPRNERTRHACVSPAGAIVGALEKAGVHRFGQFATLHQTLTESAQRSLEEFQKPYREAWGEYEHEIPDGVSVDYTPDTYGRVVWRVDKRHGHVVATGTSDTIEHARCVVQSVLDAHMINLLDTEA